MKIDFNKLILIFAICLIAGFSFAQSTTIDQSQWVYNGGMSARNLAQYTVWQDAHSSRSSVSGV